MSSVAASTCVLPSDTIANILSRLPVKSLLRFKSVCKYFQTIITSPHFVSSYCKSLHHRHTLFFCSSMFPEKLSLSLFLDLENLDCPTNITYSLHDVSSQVVVASLVGSCEGLVCFCVSSFSISKTLVLWNPSTRQTRRITFVPTKDVELTPIFGFGFDETNGVFKVVMMFANFRHEKPLFSSRLKLYSANTDSWKDLGECLPSCIVSGLPAVVRGNPHWINEELDFVVCFDMVIEAFRRIPLPDLGVPGNEGAVIKKKLQVVNECLGLVVYNVDNDMNHVNRVALWVMDNPGCWGKKFSVGPLLEFDDVVGCCRNDGLFLRKKNGDVFLYNSRTESVKRVPIEECLSWSSDQSFAFRKYPGNFRDAFIFLDYVESLAFPSLSG